MQFFSRPNWRRRRRWIRAAGLFRVSLAILLTLGVAQAEPVFLRVVAANLTSGNYQEYSPDNGNHSNPEGAGARILKGLKPDVVLIQEFNTTVPVRQWVNATFGEEFSFMREAEAQIPNGIVSRFPIVESGEWKDPHLDNRDFAWAKIALPNGEMLWAISVHFYSKKSDIREREAKEIIRAIRGKIPEKDYVVIGGDLNTRSAEEPCLRALEPVFPGQKDPPVDQSGNPATNANRTRPYDWVLPDADLLKRAVSVKVAGQEFPHGLVFDSRAFWPLDQVPPVQATDSAAPQMQHMAVVKDFWLP